MIFSSCPNLISNSGLCSATNISQINFFLVVRTLSWLQYFSIVLSIQTGYNKNPIMWFFMGLGKRKHHEEETDKRKIYCSVETFLRAFCSWQLCIYICFRTTWEAVRITCRLSVLATLVSHHEMLSLHCCNVKEPPEAEMRSRDNHVKHALYLYLRLRSLIAPALCFLVFSR